MKKLSNTLLCAAATLALGLMTADGQAAQILVDFEAPLYNGSPAGVEVLGQPASATEKWYASGDNIEAHVFTVSSPLGGFVPIEGNQSLFVQGSNYANLDLLPGSYQDGDALSYLFRLANPGSTTTTARAFWGSNKTNGASPIGVDLVNGNITVFTGAGVFVDSGIDYDTTSSPLYRLTFIADTFSPNGSTVGTYHFILDNLTNNTSAASGVFSMAGIGANQTAAVFASLGYFSLQTGGAGSGIGPSALGWWVDSLAVPVPEPASLSLVAAGLTMVVYRRRRND